MPQPWLLDLARPERRMTVVPVGVTQSGPLANPELDRRLHSLDQTWT